MRIAVPRSTKKRKIPSRLVVGYEKRRILKRLEIVISESAMTEFTISGSIVATDIWYESPSPEMRFAMRDGEKVLQQKWLRETPLGKQEFEWRDVPIVEETE